MITEQIFFDRQNKLRMITDHSVEDATNEPESRLEEA